LLLCDFKVTVL